MTNTKKLLKMLDGIIDNKSEQAEVHFHDYLQDKMQKVIHGETELSDESDTTNNEE